MLVKVSFTNHKTPQFLDIVQRVSASVWACASNPGTCPSSMSPSPDPDPPGGSSVLRDSCCSCHRVSSRWLRALCAHQAWLLTHSEPAMRLYARVGSSCFRAPPLVGGHDRLHTLWLWILERPLFSHANHSTFRHLLTSLLWTRFHFLRVNGEEGIAGWHDECMSNFLADYQKFF